MHSTSRFILSQYFTYFVLIAIDCFLYLDDNSNLLQHENKFLNQNLRYVLLFPLYSHWTKRLWRNLLWREVSFRVETAFVNVVNLLNRESRPREKTSLTEKAQYIEIARSGKLKMSFRFTSPTKHFVQVRWKQAIWGYNIVLDGWAGACTPPSLRTHSFTNTLMNWNAHFYMIWLEHYLPIDGQADYAHFSYNIGG